MSALNWMRVLSEVAGATKRDDCGEHLTFGGQVEGPDFMGLPRAPPGAQGDLLAPRAGAPCGSSCGASEAPPPVRIDDGS